ncbi:tRNA (guanosine(46)-N7)-methyltransferase TrmB [Actinobaculum sp. 352]|nr:tRNA (guanine-N7)-methyltransferase [Actinobaculum sp. 313]RTE50994.1 tRNA (guanosine(46)-N7)-methyltransferase TrmB [Actinobaculum sp. 352]
MPGQQPTRIRSFSRRGGRMARPFAQIVERHASEYLLDLPRGATPTTIKTHARCDLNEVFGRQALLAVEIGPGSGEHMVAFAGAHPDWNVLAIEAWHPGVARCMARAVKEDVHNIRLLEADAAQALPVLFGLRAAAYDDPRESTVPRGVDAAHPNAGNPRAQEVWTFFPDPWRKARHHKRRLVAEPFAAVVADALVPGGFWRLATDWDDYAWQMRDTVESERLLRNVHAGERPDPADPQPARGGFAPRWQERPLTRFERRGQEAGRHVHDLVAQRVSNSRQAGV